MRPVNISVTPLSLSFGSVVVGISFVVEDVIYKLKQKGKEQLSL